MAEDAAPRSLDGRWVLGLVLVVCVVVGVLVRGGEAPSVAPDGTDGPLRSVFQRAEPAADEQGHGDLIDLVPPTTMPIIPPGREQVVRSWLVDDEDASVIRVAGLGVSRVSIERDTVRFDLARTQAGESQDIGVVRLHHRDAAPATARVGDSLAVSHDKIDADGVDLKAAVQQLESALLLQDADSLYELVDGPADGSGPPSVGDGPRIEQPPEPRPPPAEPKPIQEDRQPALETHAEEAADERPAFYDGVGKQLAIFSFVCAGLAALALVVALFRRTRPDVVFVGKLNHLLPAILQVIIFSYWLLHWVPGRQLVGLIAVQIVVGYCLEIALSTLVRGKWNASFGVFPIVLSTNLLAQFHATSYWLGMLAIALAIAVKLLLRRDGRPMFNPSAFGLTVVGLMEIATPGIGTPDFTHQFSMPPNMAELVFVLALIVHVRLKLTLVTLSAALVLVVGNLLLPTLGFGVGWAPIVLVLCLLITDPSTIPRTPGGRVLYGACIAAGMFLLQAIFVSLGMSDFWAKVMAIPLANLLNPRFDAWAARFSGFKWLSPERNDVHLALWSAIFIWGLLGKGERFETDDSDLASPCWRAAPQGRSCEVNRLFCTPFSVRRELACWVSTDAVDPDD